MRAILVGGGCSFAGFSKFQTAMLSLPALVSVAGVVVYYRDLKTFRKSDDEKNRTSSMSSACFARSKQLVQAQGVGIMIGFFAFGILRLLVFGPGVARSWLFSRFALSACGRQALVCMATRIRCRNSIALRRKRVFSFVTPDQIRSDQILYN